MSGKNKKLKQTKHQKISKCRHDNCIRPRESGTTHGFCDRCIQLQCQQCNYCQTKESSQEASKPAPKGVFDKPLKEYSNNPLIPLGIIALIVIVIAVIGYALIRVLTESVFAFLILVIAVLGAYWIYKHWLIR